MSRKRIGGIELKLQLFVTSALDGQVSDQFRAPAALPRKRTNFNGKVGGPQRLSGHSGEKTTLAPPGFRNPNRLSHVLITIPVRLILYPLQVSRLARK
jgi:hypothetical protein